MAWTLVESDSPEMSLLATTGSIEWNSAMQALLGDPAWVEVFWEPDDRYLGVRCNYVTDGLPVYAELDKGEFKIDSRDILEDAGIGVTENVSGIPVRSSPLVGPQGSLYSSQPVWYIALPEE